MNKCKKKIEFNNEYLDISVSDTDSKFYQNKKAKVINLLGGTKLYRYVSINLNTNEDIEKSNYIIDSINKSYVYLNNPNTFNDPFECFLGVDKNRCMEKTLFQLIKEKHSDDMMNELINQYYLWSDKYKKNENLFKGLSYHEILLLAQNKNINNVVMTMFKKSPDFKLSLFSYIIHSEETLDYIIANDFMLKGILGIFSNKTSIEEKILCVLNKVNWNKIDNEKLAHSYYTEMNNMYNQLPEMVKLENDEKGICCFTTKWDNLLMWAHYGNSHKGICIEYDIEDCDEDFFLNIFPVIYKDKRIVVDDEDISMNNGQPILMNIANKGLKSCLTKSSDWMYEDEWRIICKICKEYERKYKSPKITSIILGANISKDVEKYFRDKVTKNIKYYKITKELNSFILNKIDAEANKL